MELDEPIDLASWDPEWPNAAAHLIAQVHVVLQSPDARIEHIGSTSVPGMVAKPVIDLMAGLADAVEILAAARRLGDAGWDDLGEAGVPGRRYLRRRGDIAANLHLVERSSAHWLNNLAIRDFLRMHSEETAAYARAKQEALASGHDRLLAYSVAKATFMETLLLKALSWALR